MASDPIEIQRYLRGVDYPATKDELISAADANGAPDEVIEELQAMDAEQLDGPDAVTEILGGS